MPKLSRLVVLFLLGTFTPVPTLRAADWPLQFEETFENGAARWEATDPEAWRVVPSRTGQAYSLFQQSKFKPPHRSPLNIALVKEPSVGDFMFETDVLSTKPDYNHRDMCLFFGYQDPAHFYYVHFGKKTDDRANQIFIVNGADRNKISFETTPGTDWDDAWHKVRVVRRVESGKIDVYFDDMTVPVMRAVDDTFRWGRVGVGSFDDIGDFDNVKLWGVAAGPK